PTMRVGQRGGSFGGHRYRIRNGGDGPAPKVPARANSLRSDAARHSPEALRTPVEVEWTADAANGPQRRRGRVAQDFFKAKRSWSKYKDFILNYYLEPYIPKVATLKRPIVILDCFAGCGRFGDGEPGSPLIIADAIQRWRAKGVRITGEFIEANRANYRVLCSTLAPFTEFAACRHGTFEDHLTEIERRARDHTVFLYLDPYTVKSLVYRQMKRVYDHIRNSSASVEVLMNFNVATLMRWALALLKKQADLPEEATSSEADYQADDPTELLERATLDEI